MLSALISTRPYKQVITDKLRGDVLVIKTEDSVWSANEHAQGLVVEWQDDLLEAIHSDLELNTPLVHPYRLLDENGHTVLRSTRYVNVDAMSDAAIVLDPDIPLAKKPWSEIAPYVAERE